MKMVYVLSQAVKNVARLELSWLKTTLKRKRNILHPTWIVRDVFGLVCLIPSDNIADSVLSFFPMPCAM